MVRKNSKWKEHAYVHKGVDLVSLRKFGMVQDLYTTRSYKIIEPKKLWSAKQWFKIDIYPKPETVTNGKADTVFCYQAIKPNHL